MNNQNSFLDMDVLARGCKIEDDTPSYPIEILYILPVQQPIYPLQNMMPFVQPLTKMRGVSYVY